MHFCNPSRHSNRFLRFVTMLCNPAKVYKYSFDGEDLCRTCRKGILIPHIYYNVFINSLYAVVGAAEEYLTSSLSSYIARTMIGVMVLCVFHYLVASTIFSLFTWETYDRSRFSPKYANSMAMKSIGYKLACFLTGKILMALFRRI